MKAFLSYWVWPNPAGWQYGDLKVQLLIAACVGLFLVGTVIRYWRGRSTNTIAKSLSSGWSVVLHWFAVIALMLVVSRVEQIQFFSMRLLWVVWGAALLIYIVFQVRNFHRKHYIIVEQKQTVDVRDKYLPKRK